MIVNVAINDAMILPYDANLARMEFSYQQDGDTLITQLLDGGQDLLRNQGGTQTTLSTQLSVAGAADIRTLGSPPR